MERTAEQELIDQLNMIRTGERARLFREVTVAALMCPTGLKDSVVSYGASAVKKFDELFPEHKA